MKNNPAYIRLLQQRSVIDQTETLLQQLFLLKKHTYLVMMYIFVN